MKETLVCSSCEKTWKREVTRGRKPTVCPKCIKVQNAENEKLLKAKEKSEAKKSSTTVTKSISANGNNVVKKQRKIKVSEITQETTLSETCPSSLEEEIKVSLADVYRDYYPHPANYKEFIESTKGGSTWHCSACKKVLKSEVPLVVPPTHRCPPNSTKVKEYQRVK